MPPHDAYGPVCPVCGRTAVAAFCGHCGADLTAPATSRSVLLRPRVFAAAPRERLRSVWVASSMFPRLAGAARAPFRVAFALIAAGIAVLSLLRVTGPLVAISVLAVPLLFLIYLWRSDVFADLPMRALAVPAALGSVAGVAWWLASGVAVARIFGVPTASGLLLLDEALRVGLLIFLGGMILMLLPAVVGRALRIPSREALDGYVVGALGALAYSAAATATIVGPQFTGELMNEQGPGRLFADAVTYGIATPITCAAAGGLLGMRLWFAPSDAPGSGQSARVLTAATVLAVLCAAAIGLIDGFNVAGPADLTAKGLVVILSLLTTRVAVQTALLHEVPDLATGDPILCVHCETVVPDTPFCAVCGAAARAASRSSRRWRREHAPVPVD